MEEFYFKIDPSKVPLSKLVPFQFNNSWICTVRSWAAAIPLTDRRRYGFQRVEHPMRHCTPPARGNHRWSSPANSKNTSCFIPSCVQKFVAMTTLAERTGILPFASGWENDLHRLLTDIDSDGQIQATGPTLAGGHHSASGLNIFYQRLTGTSIITDRLWAKMLFDCSL